MAREDESTSAGEDWENRRLCRDESCIGIIGADGRCTECGLPEAEADDGAVGRAAPAPETPERSDPGAQSAPGEPAEAVQGVEGTGDAGASYWQTRRLCPDGNCIGVIGPDGRCKECGRRADS